MGDQAIETLLSLTEIAVAVLGFAGVLAVMKRSKREVIAGVNQWRLAVLVIFCANAIAFSVIPVLFLATDYPENLVWLVASALCVAFMLGWLLWGVSMQKKYFASYFPRQTLFNDMLAIFICAICIAAGVDNLFAGGLFDQSFGGYLFSIAGWFYLGFMAFLRSILTIELGGEDA